MVVYALQAAGFFVGITWIVAVIIDYVKKDDARRHLARIALPLADPHLLVGAALGRDRRRSCSWS